eukprot:6678690-Lingulodinium_polyedra.AAC.1
MFSTASCFFAVGPLDRFRGAASLATDLLEQSPPSDATPMSQSAMMAVPREQFLWQKGQQLLSQTGY